MKLYMNCEKFHCSMEKNSIPCEIAEHLTISKKAKYPKINPGVDICDICSFDKSLCERGKVIFVEVED